MYKENRLFSIILLATFLAGCVGVVALSTQWTLDFNNAKYKFVHASQDEQSLFYIYQQEVESEPVIEQYDLSGRFIAAKTLPLVDRSRTGRTHSTFWYFRSDLHSLTDGGFYITAPTATNVLYHNPQSDVSWVGFGEDLTGDKDEFQLAGSLVAPNDDLLFWGAIVRDIGLDTETFDTVLGRVNKSGVIVKLNFYENLKEIDNVFISDDYDHLLVGTYTNEYRDQTGLQAVFISFNDALEHTDRFDEARYSGVYEADALLNDTILTNKGSIVDRSGAVLIESTDNRYTSSHYPDSEGNYYTTKSITGTTYRRATRISRFDKNGKLLWEYDDEHEGDYVYSYNSRVNANDELEMVITTEETTVNGVSAGVLLQDGLLLAEGDFFGRTRKSTIYQVLNPNGERVFYAKEEPYIIKGIMGIDVFEFFVKEASSIQKGVCYSGHTLFLKERRVFSVNVTCEGSEHMARLSFFE